MILMSVVLLTACGSGSREVGYKSDLKSGYCGIEVPAAVCKCAFHGTHCEEAKMTKTEASETVDTGFAEFDKEGIANFKQDCESKDGRFNSGDEPSCTYCNDGFYWEDNEKSGCEQK